MISKAKEHGCPVNTCLGLILQIDRITSQQIIEACGIELINEWVERRRRREWDEHETKVDAETLVKLLRDNIPAGMKSPGCLKRRWSDLILD